MTLNSKTISKRVFISYSHDSPEHRDKVLELSERLRADGIDARIDQYVEHEGQNWPDWCEDQIRDADLVLMVCASVYRAAVEGKALPGSRKGVCWEADQIKQEIYDANSRKEKFVPIFFEGASEDDVPARLRGVSHFSPCDGEGYEKLFRRITGQPRVQMRELGLLRSLPSLRLNPRPDQNPERYLAWLRGETGSVELERLLDSPDQLPPPAIDTLYIHLKVRSLGPDRDKVERAADIASTEIALEDILQNRTVVVEGEPGSGKTTFLRRIAWALCRADKENEQLRIPVSGFPIFIRIYRLDEHITATLAARQGGDPANADDPRWIAHYLARQGWNLDEQFFHDRLSQPGNVLLIDGLDEASSEKRREEIVAMLIRAVAQYDCNFVVSTRPGAHQRKAPLRNFTRAWIEDLKPEAVDRFLRQWSVWLKRGEETAAQAHYEALQKAVSSSGLGHLAANPLMLTALAVVHYKNRVLPEQRADLYEEIMQWLAAQAESRTSEFRYKKEDFLRWLGHLALAMQTARGGQKLEISIGKGATLIADKFDPEPAHTAEEGAARFLECAHWSCGMVTLRSGQLVFWHRTFQEYLAARALAMIGEAKRWQHCRKLLYLEEGREALPLLAGRMMTVAPEPLEELFGKLIRDAASRPDLAPRATAFAILSRMLADLESTRFRLSAGSDAAYSKLKQSVLEIFKKGKAREIGLDVLVTAAEALGTANPYLFTPREPEYWVAVPAGEFTMGAQKTDPADTDTWDPEAYDHEPVRRGVKVAPFRMGRHPVTVWEYLKFLEEADRESDLTPEDWQEQQKHPARPVVAVTWHQAERYCRWFGCALPTEEQWEFAARGTEGRRYPWGFEGPDETRGFFDGRTSVPAPVGLLPEGDTPLGIAGLLPEAETSRGIAGLVGNVWEWTRSDYNREGHKVLRGGAFNYVAWDLRAAYRYWFVPVGRGNSIGFRCVRE